MAKIEQKQLVVNEISEKLAKATSVVLIDYRGLTVEQDTVLRKRLRESGVEYKIYKNSAINLAVKGTDFEGLSEYLAGPTALALTYEDPTTASRIIAEEAKIMTALEFKAGVVDGNIYGADDMKAIASIPSREVLLSKLLGSFKSPMSSFARVIDQVAQKQA